jgi:hypothetical protein
MLLIAKKIVPKNVLFTFAMLADFFELLSKENWHLSRQNVLKTFWFFKTLRLRLDLGTGRPNRIILGLLGWKVSIIVSTSHRLLYS